jgi:preprotein translocase subunit SecF
MAYSQVFLTSFIMSLFSGSHTNRLKYTLLFVLNYKYSFIYVAHYLLSIYGRTNEQKTAAKKGAHSIL